MRTKCGHDRPGWHYLGVPFIIRRWIWKKRNECGYDRRSWHYLGVPFTIRRWIWATIEQSGYYRMWIWTNIEQSGHYRGQHRANIEQSGHYRGPNRVTWALSGVYMVQGWIWTNIGTTVDTIAQVGTISAYFSLSKSGCGPIFAKLTFCTVEFV